MITVDHRPGHNGRPEAGRLRGILGRISGRSRILSRFYGVVAYAIFLATLLYAVGFVSGLVVPKSIDTGTVWPPFVAFCIDVQLLCLFAVQHGGMARPGFKRVMAAHVSPLVARSTYVLCSSLMLILLFAAWQPLPAMVWQAADPATNSLAATMIQSLSLLGWSIVLHSILLISHFEQFGVKPALLSFAGRNEIAVPFRTPGLYGFVRHPIYLGLMIAFWAAPVMTAGHFLFASVTTGFMLVGIWLEERDLLALFGDRYRQYQKRVAMLLPGPF